MSRIPLKYVEQMNETVKTKGYAKGGVETEMYAAQEFENTPKSIVVVHYHTEIVRIRPVVVEGVVVGYAAKLGGGYSPTDRNIIASMFSLYSIRKKVRQSDSAGVWLEDL